MATAGQPHFGGAHAGDDVGRGAGGGPKGASLIPAQLEQLAGKDEELAGYATFGVLPEDTKVPLYILEKIWDLDTETKIVVESLVKERIVEIAANNEGRPGVSAILSGRL